MLKKPAFQLACALVLAAIFVAGVRQLFALHAAKGDIYPPYSSLRADPLGVKGIYDALDSLRGVNTTRNFRSLPRLQTDGPITLVYAGVDGRAAWEDRELRVFNGLVNGGTRAVFAFLPVQNLNGFDEVRTHTKLKRGKKLGAKGRKEDEKKAAKKKDDEDEDDPVKNPPISFTEAAKRWGFAFDTLPVADEKDGPRYADSADEKARLESEMTWHTRLCFKDLMPGWEVLYECEGKPVLIERRLGQGSLVFAADSFFLSNEALRKERQPLLLARLFNGPSRVVFDEDHLGVNENPGLASLARKYRLHGVFAGILLLALLFVWKNTARFIPVTRDEARDGDVVLGKESAAGFINLLRRTILPAEILPLCLAEWRKAGLHRPGEQARVEEILAADQSRPARQRNPVAAYQTIAQALTRTHHR
ncbi:MAG: hypothetical protein K8R23_08385 [Chthoniobacter sp.]|nr:hypothetical protein [Chthoniobacter sp.]